MYSLEELWMALYYCDLLYFVKYMIFLRKLFCKEVRVQHQLQYGPEGS